MEVEVLSRINFNTNYFNINRIRTNSLHKLARILPKVFLLMKAQQIRYKKLFKNILLIRKYKFGCPSTIFMNLKYKTDQLFCIAFSPDNNYLAAAGFDMIATIYGINPLNKLTFAEKVYKFADHADTINSICFSPNNLFFATGSEDTTCIIYNIKSIKMKKGKILEFFDHTSFIDSVTFSPKSNYLATGSFDKRIIIYGTNPKFISSFGRKIFILTYHTEAVASVLFSPNNEYMASSSDDMSVMLYGLNPVKHKFKYKKLCTLNQSNLIDCIAFTPDSNYIAVGKEESQAVIYGINPLFKDTYLIEVATFKQHVDMVCSVSFSYNFKYFATSGNDGITYIYGFDQIHDKKNYMNLLASLKNYTYTITCGLFSPNSFYYATCSWDKNIYVYC